MTELVSRGQRVRSLSFSICLLFPSSSLLFTVLSDSRRHQGISGCGKKLICPQKYWRLFKKNGGVYKPKRSKSPWWSLDAISPGSMKGRAKTCLLPLKGVLHNTVCTALCSVKLYALVITSNKFWFRNAFFMQSCPALLVFQAKQWMKTLERKGYKLIIKFCFVFWIHFKLAPPGTSSKWPKSIKSIQQYCVSPHKSWPILLTQYVASGWHFVITDTIKEILLL